MRDFISENASALFGLLGAVGGVCLSFFTAWMLSKREYDLRVWEKLLDRRLNAHEQLISVALELRVMVGPGTVDSAGEVVRFPQVLLSREVFEDWFTGAVKRMLSGSTWLSTEARREANFLQDYLLSLYVNLEGAPNEGFQQVGALIRQDFIDLSDHLERAAFSYLGRGIRQLSAGSLDEWHKYPREKTEQRLRDTQLLTRHAEIAELLGSSGD